MAATKPKRTEVEGVGKPKPVGVGEVVLFRVSGTAEDPVLRPLIIVNPDLPGHPYLGVSGILFMDGDADRGHEYVQRQLPVQPSNREPLRYVRGVVEGQGIGEWRRAR